VKPDSSKGVSHEKASLGPIFFKALQGLGRGPLLREALRLAAKSGRSIYLVGGMVRNLCLKVPLPNDYDFVYEGETGEFSREAARALGGSAFVLDKKNGLHRVTIKGHEGAGARTMDFLPLNYLTIEDDLRKRDFTVNAMAIPLTSFFTGNGNMPVFIDPTGGLGDCEKRRLCLVSAHALKEDPLRCLRAVRLSQSYGLTIDSETESKIREHAHLLRDEGVARERIRDELSRIFMAKATSRALCRLIDLGLFDALMPALRLIKPPPSFKTLDEAERFLDEIKCGAYSNRPVQMKRAFADSGKGLPPDVVLKITAFVYDIDVHLSKYERCGTEQEKRHGEPLFTKILKELAFSSKTVRAVKGLLSNLRLWLELPISVCDSHISADLFFCRISGETSLAPPVFFVLVRAAVLSAGRALRGSRLKALDAMEEYYFQRGKNASPQPLFNGSEIMSIFNVAEGDMVGKIKMEIEKNILTGQIKAKKDAISHIKKWIYER